MSEDVRIRAHEMRDALGLGNFGLEMIMAVEQHYEVSRRAGSALRVRMWGRRGMLSTIAGTTSMITRLRRLQIGHVVGDGQGESSAGVFTSAAGCVSGFGAPRRRRHWSSR